MTTSGKRVKGRQWQWFCNVYGIQYDLLICPWERFEKFVKEEVDPTWDRKDKEEPFGHTTIHYTTPLRIIFWFPPRGKTTVGRLGVIAHEALHGVFAVLTSRGLDPTKEGAEEAATYYLQWLMMELLRRMKEKV